MKTKNRAQNRKYKSSVQLFHLTNQAPKLSKGHPQENWN